MFVERRFGRWARCERIDDPVLCRAAREAVSGQVEADLGGYLFKRRIARQGGGKSGGYRTILGFRKADGQRVLYLYGFPKNARANITAREQAALSAVAAALLAATDIQVADLIVRGAVTELECEP